MRIAINTRFLLTSKMEGFGWFTFEVVHRIVKQHPEHEFIFFFDRKFDERFIFAENVKGVVLNPPARHPILFKIWFDYSVTKALKKYKIDLFFSPDGYLSLKTKVKQIGVIHDLNFEHYPEDLPNSALKYLKKYFPLFAKKAAHILTVSQYSKDDICETYNISPSKVTVSYNGASDLFKPITFSVQELIRSKYTNGESYFVFVGALHARKNVARLFQAFDQFKTATGSKTKLAIVGEKLWNSVDLESSYNALNHQKDVIFTGHLPIEHLTQIVGAAKALVFPSYFEGFGIPLVEAMRANCPVISGNLTSLPEIAGDAALFVDPFSVDSISEGLQRMDEDENLRTELIEKGKVRGATFSWDKTANIIWDVIEKEL
ncbi:MAG: glycosyltransferase family 1 protein [Crocinitomicaceae bacterium]